MKNYLYDWNEHDGKDDPYLGILGLADAIIVGGDSRSMCCEANMSCNPVYIYAPDEDWRFVAELHQKLYNHKIGKKPNSFAKTFSEFIEHGIMPWKYEPLDTAGDIAKEALAHWRLMRQQTSVNSL